MILEFADLRVVQDGDDSGLDELSGHNLLATSGETLVCLASENLIERRNAVWWVRDCVSLKLGSSLLY